MKSKCFLHSLRKCIKKKRVILSLQLHKATLLLFLLGYFEVCFCRICPSWDTTQHLECTLLQNILQEKVDNITCKMQNIICHTPRLMWVFCHQVLNSLLWHNGAPCPYSQFPLAHIIYPFYSHLRKFSHALMTRLSAHFFPILNVFVYYYLYN